MNTEKMTISKKKILVVEDHPIAQKMARIILSNLDFEVDIAGSGMDALGLFDEGKYVLIFMDIGLPDLDGYSVTTQIRRRENPSQSRIPIIGLSVHANQQTLNQALESGMNDYIVKPITVENCSMILSKFLSPA